MKGWMISYWREVILLCSNIYRLRQIGLLREQPDLPAVYLSVNHDIRTVRSDMQWFAHECFQKPYDEKIEVVRHKYYNDLLPDIWGRKSR